MSKISVVVPIYNAGSKLHKCIRSILSQSFNDFELILVNDGSTDSSLKICMIYEEQDNRIIVINKSNEGSIATRNKGIQAAQSPYIMFVDADDWIDKDTIEILYSETIANDADITVCNINKVIGSGLLFKKKVNSNSYFENDKLYDEAMIRNELVKAYLHGHPFPASLYAKLYKRELLINSGEYVKRIKYLGDDLFYNVEIFLKAKKVKVIDKYLYYYRAGGFTTKYMPYLFEDMVNGYLIQKEVIENYYQDSRDEQYYGISLMLLNTFKTCLLNLFNSPLSDTDKRETIARYVSDLNVVECLDNEGSKTYFESDYLNAIRNKNIDYLFGLGKRIHLKRIPRTYAVKLISKVL